MKVNQFLWDKGKVLLFASKTENERYVPLSKGIARVVHARIREGLSDDEFLFPRARVSTFDNAIARACRKAAKLAKLNYGQKNGFTCHSLRHTFITDLTVGWEFAALPKGSIAIRVPSGCERRCIRSRIVFATSGAASFGTPRSAPRAV